LSALAGLFHRDGRPLDRPMFERMPAAVPHRGPDGSASWTDRSIGFSFQAFHTTKESRLEAQPLSDARSGCTIVFDGRIDNREDLTRALDCDPAAGDAALALAACGRWGDSGPAHIVGDFAFAVWNPRERRLFCARDILGVRPFYYAIDPGTIAFATDHRQVLAAGLLAASPNEGVVAEFLSVRVRERDETLIEGLRRLPPAHALSVTPERCVLTRYWRFDPAAELRYADDREYAEHFFDVFGRAVAARLRTERPQAACFLSGGLDSSSVFGMTQWFARHKSAPDVETFSMVFPGDSTADERAYIDDVAGLWKRPSHRFAPRRPDAAAIRAQAALHQDLPDNPSDHLARGMREGIAARDIRVALTGAGGDHGFAGSLYHYADLLRAGRLVSLARQVRADRSITDVGWTPSSLFTMGVLPLLPAVWKDALRPAARKLGWPGGTPAWIPRRFADRVGLDERTRVALPRTAVSRAATWDSFDNGFTQWALELLDRTDADLGIEERHPFYDRRVMEFALAIPEPQRWRGPTTKYVLRAAMGDLLPASVRARTNKADFSRQVVGAIIAMHEAGEYARLPIADLGWIDRARVDWMYGNMLAKFDAGDEAYTEHMFPLWMIAAVNQWFETATGAVPAATGKRGSDGRTERQSAAG
jgi:asparagine synthase (glutamine-hydrolysing)